MMEKSKKIEQSTEDFLRAVERVKYNMYHDSAGRPSIGVGHLILPNEDYLLTATLNDEQVNDLLFKDLATASACVNGVVKAEINQNQFDSLVSFTFNEGAHAFATSTLLRSINAVADQETIT